MSPRSHGAAAEDEVAAVATLDLATPVVSAGMTPAETIQSAAHWAQQHSFTEQVELLLATVGPRITAAGAGLTTVRQLPAWRKGEVPRQEICQHRVAAMAEYVAAIMAHYPSAVAASFLRSSQPTLDDRSPVVMLHGATDESIATVQGQIRGSVRAFLIS